jgi:hypothetical protein
MRSQVGGWIWKSRIPVVGVARRRGSRHALAPRTLDRKSCTAETAQIDRIKQIDRINSQ